MATNVTLRMLIHYAYDLPGYPDSDNRIVGGPSWIDSATFDITGKAPEAATPKQLNLMLQPLLADRFQLKFHWVTKEITQYTLVVGKRGIKFREADPNYAGNSVLAHITMQGLTKFLAGSSLTDHTAPFDKTGLSGTYDLDSPLHESPPPGTLSVIDWWVEQMPSRLGLELKREKGPAQFFVIDSAEKPSAN